MPSSTTHNTPHAGRLYEATSTTLRMAMRSIGGSGDLRMRGQIHESNHDLQMRHLKDDISGGMMDTLEQMDTI